MTGYPEVTIQKSVLLKLVLMGGNPASGQHQREAFRSRSILKQDRVDFALMGLMG
jgi:hypothetical protein